MMSDERDADLLDAQMSSEAQSRSPGAVSTDEQAGPDAAGELDDVMQWLAGRPQKRFEPSLPAVKSARLAVQVLTQKASPSVRVGLTSAISLPAFEGAVVGRFAGPVLPEVSVGLSTTAVADTYQAMADRFADLLPTKAYLFTPSSLWGGRHTEAFEMQRGAQSIAASLAPAPDWSEKFAKALDTRYGADWSPVAAWRPQSAAWDNLLSVRIPTGLVAPVLDHREPLNLRERIGHREPTTTVREAVQRVGLEDVIEDPSLIAYRRSAAEKSALRAEAAVWLTLLATLAVNPDAQRFAARMIDQLQEWLRSVGC